VDKLTATELLFPAVDKTQKTPKEHSKTIYSTLKNGSYTFPQSRHW